MGKSQNLFSIFFQGLRSSFIGLRLTIHHLAQARNSRKIQDIRQEGYFLESTGISTLKYPYASIPAPDHGRYQLYNEIEDCIVCDKCAKICPVDCIDIEPIKSAEEFGKTSDGTSKRIYAAKFDIDMAKCCFCGLCTTVCPTECLTMTDEYDFSVFNLGKLNFGFGNLSEEEAEQKRKEWEEAQARKKTAISPEGDQKEEKAGGEEVKAGSQAGFRPRMPSAPVPNPRQKEEKKETKTESEIPKPAFQPRMRPAALKTEGSEKPEEPIKQEDSPAENRLETETKPTFQPRMRPVIKSMDNVKGKPVSEQKPENLPQKPENETEENKTKPAFQPRMRPVIKPKPPEENG